MSNAKRPSIRAARIAASCTAILLLGACSPHRSENLSQSENMLILKELSLQSAPAQYQPTESSAPVLVAGDWLAIQCAQAGNYFQDFDWAPVYANIETSGFE